MTDIDPQDRVDARVDASGASLPNTQQRAGAAAGAGAVGAHEVGKQHDATTTGTRVGETAHTTSGPHSSNLANKLDPGVDNNRDTNAQGTSCKRTQFPAPGTSTSTQCRH